MARTVGTLSKPIRVKKMTSIGRSPFSRPVNKSKRRTHKAYRGQGR